MTSFRVDLGDKPGETFSVKKITINGNFIIVIQQLFIRALIYILFLILLLFYILIYPKLNINKIEEKISAKTILIFTLSLFLLMVALKINVSSMRQYTAVLPNNIASSNVLTLGASRIIRSDEWLVNVSSTFYSFYNGSVTSLFSWISAYIIPYNWGYLFLPHDYAFAFSTLSPYFVLFISGIYLFKMFVKDNNLFAIVASFIILFSPAIAWWNSMRTYGDALAIIALFYQFFKNDSFKNKILCGLGLAIFLPTFALQQYPAWQVPLMFLSIFIVFGIYIQEKKFVIKKTDFIYIFIVLVFLAFVLYCFFYSSKEFVESVSSTVYPGKRFENGGGLDWSYFGNYLTVLFSPFKSLTFSNNSEASAFITLFPTPIIIYFVKRNELNKYKSLNFIFAFIILSLVYMCIGFVPILSTLTFFSYTTPARLFPIFEFALLILLLLELYYVNEVKDFSDLKSSFKKDFLKFNLPLALFLYYIFMKHNEIINYLSVPVFILISLGVIILSNLIILGKKKLVLSIFVILTIFSGVTVNPINFGTGIMDKTPISIDIRKINSEDEGNWITLDDIILSKYFKAQGAECLNAMSYPPRFDLFHPIDEDREYENVYNRFAHVIVILTEEPSSFVLCQPDLFRVNLNINDLDEWNIKYIATKNEITLQTDELYSECIFKDKLDGVNIYKIHYKKR